MTDKIDRPTKVLVFSEHDLPRREATHVDMLLGIPAVIEWEGEPHEVRSSPYVPAGQMYVFDTAALAAPRADHPHTNPGDGRTECQPCGKYVWPAIHSCKGVPVTARARARSGLPPEVSR